MTHGQMMVIVTTIFHRVCVCVGGGGGDEKQHYAPDPCNKIRNCTIMGRSNLT